MEAAMTNNLIESSTKQYSDVSAEPIKKHYVKGISLGLGILVVMLCLGFKTASFLHYDYSLAMNSLDLAVIEAVPTIFFMALSVKFALKDSLKFVILFGAVASFLEGMIAFVAV